MIDSSLSQQNRYALGRLRLRWLAVAAIYTLVIVATYFVLQSWGSPAFAQRWVLMAGVVMIFELAVLWVGLPFNHSPDEQRLRAVLGSANILTLARGLLLCLLGGFLFSPWPPTPLAWAPAILYTVARIIDYCDGYLARRSGIESKLGSILDIEFDGLGVLIAVSLAIQYGQMPLWYLPLALARQLFVAGMWVRERRGRPVHPLPESDNRRLTAGFQTAFLSVVLWPVFGPPLTTLASVLFAIPLAFSFGRDWWVVSGHIDPASRSYQRTRGRIKSVFEGWLPLVARVAGATIAIMLLASHFAGEPTWRSAGSDIGLEPSLSFLLAIAVLAAVAVPFFLLGIVARAAAVPLIALACLEIVTSGLDWQSNAWLLISAVIVLHLGGGRYAVWQPEETILRRQWGGQDESPP